jgi:hypothetical protein
METQCTNINEIITGATGLKCMFYESLKAAEASAAAVSKAFSGFALLKPHVEHYSLILLRSALKEILGADMEVKLLVMLVSGYLLMAKENILKNPVIEKVKAFTASRQQIPQTIYN